MATYTKAQALTDMATIKEKLDALSALYNEMSRVVEVMDISEVVELSDSLQKVSSILSEKIVQGL